MGGKIAAWIHKHQIIVLIILAAILLRIPSLFEPYWYGDEGIYLTIGLGLRRGLELYKQIHDNKPPFLYLMAAIANGNLFWFKFLAGVFNISTIIVFWKLACVWWKDTKLAAISTICFALFTALPKYEGNIANAELFFLLPTTLAFYLLFTHKNYRHIAAGGILLGLAALFKVPSLIEVAVWPLFWLTIADRNWFKKSVVLGSTLVGTFLVSVFYFWIKGDLSSYLVAAGLQNVPYLSSWQTVDGLIGTLKGRAFLTALLISVWLLIRKKIDLRLYLVGLLWSVTLFAVFLSGRPYPHYLLQLAVAISLGISFLFTKYISSRLMVAINVVLIVFLTNTFHFYTYPILSYYKNFAKFITRQTDKTNYYAWFNPSVNRNYEIARLIKSNTTQQDNIFIWGDEPSIYALSKRLPAGKYTAAYHIFDFGAANETLSGLQDTMPRYIVTFSNESQLPGLDRFIGQRYLLERTIENSRVYRRLGPK
jgi:hypothetical protein